MLPQARVARAALLRALDRSEEEQRLGGVPRQVYGIAASLAGRKLRRKFEIETLEAVRIDEIRAKSPQHELRLRTVERVMSARADGGRSSAATFA